MGAPPPAPTPVTLTPAFKLVFLSVLGLTLLCMVVMIWLAVRVQNPSQDVGRLIETCSTAFKLGFGAIVGLIGGKAL